MQSHVLTKRETVVVSKPKKKKWWKSYTLYFILPAFLLYSIFIVYPTASSLYLSLTSWNGLSPEIKFIGLDNFKEIFQSERVHNAFKNTIILTVVLVILENIVALGLAVLIEQIRRFSNFFRIAFYLPVLLSGIVMGFIWKIIYNYNFGALSQILDKIGLGEYKLDWLGDSELSLFAIIFATVWKQAGYYMIIYLAALQGVPQELQEAAKIDGANRWQQFRHVTFPLLSGAVTVSVILSTISSLKIFDQIAIMTDGGPGFATETLTYVVYKVAFAEARQGFGTALALVLFVLILIVAIIQIRVLRKREVQL
jgi:multiple sugar transport system permease protein/raffinose/stachyose/melibiose transport system permease protein